MSKVSERPYEISFYRYCEQGCTDNRPIIGIGRLLRRYRPIIVYTLTRRERGDCVTLPTLLMSAFVALCDVTMTSAGERGGERDTEA